MGVEGSIVSVNAPPVAEVKDNVVVDQFTAAPDAPALMVPVKVAVNVPGLGETSPGTLNVTLSVNDAPLTEERADEVAPKFPKVTLEDSPGFKPTLSSLFLEVNWMVVPPIVSAMPSALTVPPVPPAWNLPEVLAVKITGEAETETSPRVKRVNAPSSQSVACFFDRIIFAYLRWL